MVDAEKFMIIHVLQIKRTIVIVYDYIKKLQIRSFIRNMQLIQN